MEVEERHGLLRSLPHRFAVEDRQKAERLRHRLTPKEDIGTDREIVGKGQILVDRPDTLVACLLWSREVNDLAIIGRSRQRSG